MTKVMKAEDQETLSTDLESRAKRLLQDLLGAKTTEQAEIIIWKELYGTYRQGRFDTHKGYMLANGYKLEDCHD